MQRSREAQRRQCTVKITQVRTNFIRARGISKRKVAGGPEFVHERLAFMQFSEFY